MFTITSHQINANQNHNEVSHWGISSHSCQNGHHYIKKKKPQVTNVDGDVEKRECSYTLGGNINWCRHYGEQYGGFYRN